MFRPMHSGRLGRHRSLSAGCAIRQVPANTIIMSFKLSLGKVAITSEPLYTNEAIMAFVDRKERPLSLSFLFHLFKSKDWSAGTNKAVLGMTLNKATLKEISIPVPPLSEQEDIAEKLDAVSRLITLREQQLHKLDQLASSRFFAAITPMEVAA